MVWESKSEAETVSTLQCLFIIYRYTWTLSFLGFNTKIALKSQRSHLSHSTNFRTRSDQKSPAPCTKHFLAHRATHTCTVCNQASKQLTERNPGIKLSLVGGFNSFEKHQSKWIIFPKHVWNHCETQKKWNPVVILGHFPSWIACSLTPHTSNSFQTWSPALLG